MVDTAIENRRAEGDATAGLREVIKDIHSAADPEQHMARLCLLYTSPSPRDLSTSRMPSSA